MPIIQYCVGEDGPRRELSKVIQALEYGTNPHQPSTLRSLWRLTLSLEEEQQLEHTPYRL